MRELPNCPVCLRSGASEKFAGNYSGTAEQASAYFLTYRQKAVHGRIVSCDHCGFVFTSPQFTAEEYERIYRDVAAARRPEGHNRAVAMRYRRLADAVRALVPPGGRFLDFGCGEGDFLDCMPEFISLGLELRSGDAQAERAKDGKIILGSLNTAIGSGLIGRGSFDFITAWDVFEHLPDLEGDTRTLQSLLKPGGWIFCTVPNVASFASRLSGEKWNCYLLEHLWYFSPATLRMFFERLGFAARDLRPFLFPADLETLSVRVAQTYGVRIPVPNALKLITLPLPAGVVFGAFQLKP